MQPLRCKTASIQYARPFPPVTRRSNPHLVVAVDRRRVLRAALGCGGPMAGATVLTRATRPHRPRGLETTPAGRPAAAYRILVQAEDSWGLSAAADQTNAPVTTGWTWIAFDQWQVPRREPAIIGTGAFLRGGAAITVASSGRLWQDVHIAAAGSYRLFLRLVDFGGGVNRIVVECAGVTHAYEWGSRWRALNTAALLRRVRGVHSLISWREVGAFPLTAGA